MQPRCLSAVLLGLAMTQCAERAPAPQAAPRGGPFYDVRDYGAVADGRTKSTEAIRKAIDAAARAGGGTVVFPAGQYLTGPIRLKSNLTLLVEAGAVVKFSTDFGDYLPMVRSRWEGTEVTNFSPLIYADRVQNVAIQGRGVLDGQGEPWWNQYRALRAEREKTGAWATVTPWQNEFLRRNGRLEMPDDPDRLRSGFLRPPLIQLLDSTNISIRDITLQNSPFWTINPVNCEGVTVSGVTIVNPPEAPNTDGINPESCRNVHISDCHISVGDDCVTIKSGRDREARRRGQAAENYTITNSTMLRGHGGVVIGSEMSGGVRNIAISNCIFDGTDRGIRIKSSRGRGGVVEDVRVSNIVMRNVREEAITLSLLYRQSPPERFSERTPRFQRIHLGGITGSAAQAGSLLGLEESPLEDVSLTDVSLVTRRGILVQEAKHVRLRSVRVDTEAGPAVAVERAEQVELIDVTTGMPHPATPVIRLSNVQQANLRGAFVPPGTEVFLELRGERTDGVVVEGIDFANAKRSIDVLPGVPARALVSAAPEKR
jgi:polygalacturonase